MCIRDSQRHVLQNIHRRAGAHSRILIHTADEFRPLVFLEPSDIPLIYPDAAAVDGDTAADDIERGGLARTI